jgi:hypothetical protein
MSTAADIIVLVGYDPIEMRIDWRDAWKPSAGRPDCCGMP